MASAASELNLKISIRVAFRRKGEEGGEGGAGLSMVFGPVAGREVTGDRWSDATIGSGGG